MIENHHKDSKNFKQKADADLEEYKAILLSHKREYNIIKFLYMADLFSEGFLLKRRDRKVNI